MDDAFFAKLLATFRQEADEHLKTISSGLLELEKESRETVKKELIEKIFREAHSLKGAARSVNQKSVAEICQSLENIFSLWKQGSLAISSSAFDPLYEVLDVITHLISHPEGEVDITPSLNQIKTILEGRQVDIPEKASITLKDLQIKEEETLRSSLKAEKMVRVSFSKLDKLFQESEEMLMLKFMAKENASEIQRIEKKLIEQHQAFNKHLTEVKILKENLQKFKLTTQEKEGMKKVSEFLEEHQQWIYSLKVGVQKLAKSSKQNSHLVSSLVDGLMEDAKKILVQPMDTLFEALPRMVRDIAHQLNKEINFKYQGGEIEIDRRILDEIKDGVLHLIRNAIDHGIESPEERIKQNKPPYGTIQVIANEISGNSVEISILDDGKGIDIEKIKQKALEKGLIDSNALGTISKNEILKMLFHLGISTSQVVTDLSGRGLGLGIVAEKVDRLDGKILIDTEPQRGTAFKLVLPLTLATFRSVLVSCAHHDFLIPTQSVKRILKVKAEEIKEIEGTAVIEIDGLSVSYVLLSEVLQLPLHEGRADTASYAVVVKAGEKCIAFGLDEVHKETEVLIKRLGVQFEQIKNVMAATIVEGDKVIPILSPVDLVHTAMQGEKRTRKLETLEEHLVKNILLVEDSMTTRLLLKNILESAGYFVIESINGQDAFEKIQEKKFDLVLTDIEMPQMDGFALVEKIRKIPKLQDLPIIICSARGSQADRERGIEIGANAYLDKSHFTQDGLLVMIQKLL